MNEEDKLLPFKFDVSEWEKKTGIKISDRIKEGRYKLRDLIEILEFARIKAGYDSVIKMKKMKEDGLKNESSSITERERKEEDHKEP